LNAGYGVCRSQEQEYMERGWCCFLVCLLLLLDPHNCTCHPNTYTNRSSRTNGWRGTFASRPTMPKSAGRRFFDARVCAPRACCTLCALRFVCSAAAAARNAHAHSSHTHQPTTPSGCCSSLPRARATPCARSTSFRAGPRCLECVAFCGCVFVCGCGCGCMFSASFGSRVCKRQT
jgi:hypothetical protein